MDCIPINIHKEEVEKNKGNSVAALKIYLLSEKQVQLFILVHTSGAERN